MDLTSDDGYLSCVDAGYSRQEDALEPSIPDRVRQLHFPTRGRLTILQSDDRKSLAPYI